MSIAGNRILVVGANGALGSAIAGRLMDDGAEVLGTARSDASSARLPAGLSERLLLDLASEESITVLSDYLLTCGKGLDGIVIASGVVGFGSVADTAPAVAAILMQVNHSGPASLVTRLLPLLTQSAADGRGPFVLSICGVVAERGFPSMSAYVASKTAHSAWLRVLRTESRRGGIRVIDARPGHTETGLSGRALFGTAPAFPTGMTTDHVADVIIGAIRADTTELASGDF